MQNCVSFILEKNALRIMGLERLLKDKFSSNYFTFSPMSHSAERFIEIANYWDDSVDIFDIWYVVALKVE